MGPGDLSEVLGSLPSSSDPRLTARLITEVPGGTVFYSLDHQGTPLALTGAKGDVVSQRRTYPYGRTKASAG